MIPWGYLIQILNNLSPWRKLTPIPESQQSFFSNEIDMGLRLLVDVPMVWACKLTALHLRILLLTWSLLAQMTLSKAVLCLAFKHPIPSSHQHNETVTGDVRISTLSPCCVKFSGAQRIHRMSLKMFALFWHVRYNKRSMKRGVLRKHLEQDGSSFAIK